ncbi:MAG: M81 family metallopeptidase [Chitinophagaceae bacterium]|nr:M81 family metallopeptidase [Chitinophagaceae bacterium]MCW5927315.1 M81 family metallopeptidase [Chitinophagaceae bacterium]
MSYRVAILGIYHESNTFVKVPTTLDDFRNGHLMKGWAICAEYASAHHEIGGMLEVLNREGIEIVPVFFAEATPGGKITAGTCTQLLGEMFEVLRKVLPVDACLVVPHGAAVCEEHADMDGYWLSVLRNLVGEKTLIVGTLDPHANVSSAMIEATDVLVSYRTNPHIDQRRTGTEAAELLVRMLKNEIVPHQQLLQLPLAISIEQQYTSKDPCRSLYALVDELRNNDPILSISINLGFPYADVREMGSTVIIITNNQPESAQKTARHIKKYIVDHQEDFRGIKKDVNAVITSLGSSEKPVLMLDMGDNVGGGAPGNSTVLLDAIEKGGVHKAFICLYDPNAVLQTSDYQTGDQFELVVTDHLNVKKYYDVALISCGDGKFHEPDPRHGGQAHFDMGRIAIVRTARGNVIMLTSLRISPFSLKQLTHFGINPDMFDVVIAKGVNAPIAAYAPVCPTILQVNTPGFTQADMTLFAYANRKKPMFPFEKITMDD